MKWNVITHLTKTCGFESQEKLATAVGLTPSTISSMKAANRIPSNRQEEIIRVGRLMGLDIVPDDFFPPDLRSDRGKSSEDTSEKRIEKSGASHT